MPSAFKLMGRMVGLFRQRWTVLGGIVLIYGLLNLVLVRGFSIGGGYDTIRQNLQHGGVDGVLSGSTLFLYLLGSSGTSSSASVTSGSYQFILMLVVSLALIWTFRQLMAGEPVETRDGFYKGMTPLVPFILVACVMFIQLIPMVVGITLYSAVVTNGVASVLVERIVWGLVTFALSMISLYLLSSSVFALYAVTLPDMTPMKALRGARTLVAGRRLTVLSRVVFLPIMLMVVTAVVIIPLLLIMPPVALWAFFALGVASIAVVHGYMYTVYRALLDE